MSRWKKAQSAERAFWEGRSRRIHQNEAEVRDRRSRLAEKIVGAIAAWVDVNALNSMRILEIGGGPVPLCTFLRSRGVVVDPLASFYRKRYRKFLPFDRFAYLAAIGEALPFRARSFRVVLCDNVLEHVLSVPELLDEVRRVCQEGAMVYIKIDLYSLRWNLVRGMLALSGIWHNVEHPQTHGRRRLERMIGKAGMGIVHAHESARYRAGWKRIVDSVLGPIQQAEYVVKVPE